MVHNICAQNEAIEHRFEQKFQILRKFFEKIEIVKIVASGPELAFFYAFFCHIMLQCL